MIVAIDEQHTTVRVGAGVITVFDSIHAAIHARAFAVPHRENPVVVGIGQRCKLLRTGNGRRSEVLVDAWLKDDVIRRQLILDTPKGHVEMTERANRDSPI